MNKCIEIINCEFKRNKAKRHGGALSIRTGKSVLIRDCEFESNVANNENNSSELLFTNHYDWKNKGFGGAIYLNPTFRTDDGNDYAMKNVTITNCIFRMNRAYQGYAIYIEGENCETTFSINDNNQFIDNYQSENSPCGGGIIASEITTIDINHIKTENSFSNSNMYGDNLEPFMYVDYFWNPLPRTNSDFFSSSEIFSRTSMFSISNIFSETSKF